MSKLETLQEMLLETPNDPFLFFAMALEHLKLNNTQEAVSLFEKLHEQHPTYLATYLHFGNLLSELGKSEKAELVFNEGIALAKSQQKLKAMLELQQALFLMD